MNKILQLLDGATDAALMLSRKNCHVRGVHSIVLRDLGGRLVRAFLTSPDHLLHQNTPEGGCSIGIHDHLYGLTLEGVTGTPCNHNFTKGLHAGATLFHKFASTPDRKVKMPGLHPLTLSSFQWLYPGDKLALTDKDLHTVFVPENQQASWLVYEGVRCKPTSLLYTVKPDPVCTYERFASADQVRAFVKQFFTGAKI